MVAIERIAASAYTIPTDAPEGDGTLQWDSTTLVVVEASGGGQTGLGYSYTDQTAASLIQAKLAPEAMQHDGLDPPAAWRAMQRAVRNLGRAGLVSTAISAVDTALWDLKAKVLGVSLASLLGKYRDAVPVYGSGGFTTYSNDRLCDQLSDWVERDGCQWVKMKIGTHPQRDPERVKAARAAIGDRGLFVDANGAFAVKQAQQLAERFAAAGVTWFEEPVSSDDLEGLHRLRAAAPAGMEIAAGEYGYTTGYFQRMLTAGAVDVLQADATRCCGFTGWLQVAALCEAQQIDLSAHCAPSLHLSVACAAPRFRHIEWFHDHVRIEQMLFDGAPRPRQGLIKPDLTRPGLGLAFKHPDAKPYRVL